MLHVVSSFDGNSVIQRQISAILIFHTLSVQESNKAQNWIKSLEIISFGSTSRHSRQTGNNLKIPLRKSASQFN